jgi:hypothetical protein
VSSTDWEEGREGDAERVDADELAKVPPGSAEEVTDDDAAGVGGGDWTTRPTSESGDLTDETAAESQSATVGDVGPPTTSGDVRTTGETAGSGWTAGGGTLGAEGTGSPPGTDDLSSEPGATRRRDDDD